MNRANSRRFRGPHQARNRQTTAQPLNFSKEDRGLRSFLRWLIHTQATLKRRNRKRPGFGLEKTVRQETSWQTTRPRRFHQRAINIAWQMARAWRRKQAMRVDKLHAMFVSRQREELMAHFKGQTFRHDDFSNQFCGQPPCHNGPGEWKKGHPNYLMSATHRNRKAVGSCVADGS